MHVAVREAYYVHVAVSVRGEKDMCGNDPQIPCTAMSAVPDA